MSLWGPALDAEIEYRQTQAKTSWGGKQTSWSARTDRISRREKAQEAPARPSRTEQIKKGIAGMRPVSTPARGLFA